MSEKKGNGKQSSSGIGSGRTSNSSSRFREGSISRYPSFGEDPVRRGSIDTTISNSLKPERPVIPKEGKKKGE